MRGVEIVLAAALAALGVRSAWIWLRRPLEGAVFRDHILYALYLTGRVGIWFALAGFFVIFALIDAEGRALLDEVDGYRWYVLVPIGLAALQLVAGVLLGWRSMDEESPSRSRGRSRPRAGGTP